MCDHSLIVVPSGRGLDSIQLASHLSDSQLAATEELSAAHVESVSLPLEQDG